MMTDIAFIDMTLGYALKNKLTDRKGAILLKRKITELSRMVFDIPAACLKEHEGLTAEEPTNVRVCVRPAAEELRKAHGLGCSRVRLSCGGPVDEKALPCLREALSEAGRLGMKATVGCIDISEESGAGADMFQKLANEYEIHSVVVHDYGSRLDPLATCRVLDDMRQRIGCAIEYGGKNALGLATGNTLGAIRSGICAVSASIGGVGGFPAFEEVLMSMRHLFKLPVQVPKNLALCCKEVLELIGTDIPNTKPVIGSNIFAHESGIHVDGVIKKSDLYEPFAPEEVGLSRRIVIGKHSGRAAVEQKVRELNISVEPSCIALLLDRVRSLAVKQKAALADEQLEQLAREVVVCEGACY